MVSASGLVGTVAFIIWGCVSDSSKSRFGRRKPLLIIGSSTTAILMVGFGLSTNYWWLFICDGILIAITSNMFHVTNRALIPDIWETEKRGKINSFMFIGSSIGSAFVWITSLLLLPGESQTFDRQTHQMMFLIAALGLIIAAICVGIIVKEPPIPTYIIQNHWTISLKSLFDFKALKKHPDFLKMFGASLIVIMASNAFRPFILISLQELSFSRDLIIITAVFLISAISLVMYLLFKGLDRIGRKRVTFVCLFLAPIGCFLLGFSRGALFPSMIGLTILFPFMTALDIAIGTWTQDLLPEDERGKFLGIINIGKAAGQAPGALLAGWVADVFKDTLGVYAVFIITGLFLFLAIPAFLKVPETVKKTI
jgi:MFS family permease